MAIPAQYKSMLVTALIVAVTLYVISHYYKDAAATFGISYVGA